jgi:hypothetical protein
MRRALTAGVCIATAVFGACGGGAKPPPAEDNDPTVDSGVVTPVDAGPPKPPNPVDPHYPAAHTPLPPVTYNGGNILDVPKIVTVTFDGDDLRSTAEAFDDVITTTAWWDAVSPEYCDSRGKCIGHGSSGGHVHVSTPPEAGYDDTAGNGTSSLKTYIDSQIQSGLFPAPDENTIYVIYFPSTTTITLDGAKSCEVFGGYHNAMTTMPPEAGGPVQFAYAIIPRCTVSQDDLTVSASHEIIEAATDPFITPTADGYYAYGSDTSAWDFAGGGGEVGDRCFDVTGMSDDTYMESGFLVQRTWSNAAAKASHDPCVPAPSPKTTPYFNVAPKGSDMLTMAVGDTKVIELTAFSDGPTGTFAIDTMELSEFFGVPNVLGLSLDETGVQNGQKAHLTVELQGTPSLGYATFLVTSRSGVQQHAWSFLVQTM